MIGVVKKVRQVFELVKFSHTLFALPFALASLLVATGGLPSLRLFLLILAAMVTARNAAMAFNRAVDAEIDARNPRTVDRPIPQGLISRRATFLFTGVNAILFVLIAAQINRPCLLTSPAALALFFFYSYTKRFAAWSHFVLGLALGLSPIGAWLAVRGTVAGPPVFLGGAVLCWVAGFDIIYATQDYEFDRREGLHSLVVRLGIPGALWASKALHVLTLALLFCFGWMAGLQGPFYLGFAVIAVLFAYEHSLVSPTDLSRVNAAFFNVNGFVSLIFLSAVTLSLPGNG